MYQKNLTTDSDSEVISKSFLRKKDEPVIRGLLVKDDVDNLNAWLYVLDNFVFFKPSASVIISMATVGNSICFG